MTLGMQGWEVFSGRFLSQLWVQLTSGLQNV
jgi:hypothetical protein